MKPFPALMISHGSPVTAIEPDDYTAALSSYAKKCSKPKAIIVMSAHWLTDEAVEITASHKPEILYDFGGFPDELYLLQYGCPGSPELASKIVSLLSKQKIPAQLNHERGIDHGVWIPLRIAYPEANIPVIQISLPITWKPEEILRIGKTLAPLRNEDLLLIGSGGAVHNLRALQWRNKTAPTDSWAMEYKNWVKGEVMSGKADSLLQYLDLAPNVRMAHPTLDHWLPIFFTMGLHVEGDRYAEICDGFEYGNLSTLSFAFEK